MGLQHCLPGEVVNLLLLNEHLPSNTTVAIAKTEDMEIIRMFLPQGKKIPEHSVTGEITVQCLSGRLDFIVEGDARELRAADWLYLSANQKHSLCAFEDSVILVTIYLK